MKKVLLLIYAGTETHEAKGRVTNALTMARELDEEGHTVHVAFDGAGVQWPALIDKGHDLASVYTAVEENVVSVCDFCADAFDADVDERLREDEYHGHQSFAEYFEEGWEVVTF